MVTSEDCELLEISVLSWFWFSVDLFVLLGLLITPSVARRQLTKSSPVLRLSTRLSYLKYLMKMQQHHI